MLQFLFSPTKQFLYDSGKLLAGGKIYVYLKDTQNLATLHDGETGEGKPNPIVLDANGRASVKADDVNEYRLEIYTPYDTLVYTCNAFYAEGGEGGGTFIVSHDGSLSGNGTSQNPLGVINIPLAVDNTMTAYTDIVEGVSSLVLGVNGDWFNDTFGSALNDKVDWSSFSACCSAVEGGLDQKLDASAYDLSNYYNKQETTYLLSNYYNKQEIDETVDVINQLKQDKLTFGYDENSAISSINNSALAGGQGGDTTPWISGAKILADTQTMTDNMIIQVLSSFTLSGNKNHCIAVKGGVYRFPNKWEIASGIAETNYFMPQSSMSGYLPISSFSSYTASIQNNLNSNWDYTNSAYGLSISNFYNKLDASAFSALSAVQDPVLIGDSNITAISSKVDSHTQWNLSVNAAPVVTDTRLIGDNCITAHTTETSGEWFVGLVQSAYEAIDSVGGISSDVDTLKNASGNYYPMTGNPSGFLTEHQSLTDYYKKTETSSKKELSDAFANAGRSYRGDDPIYVNNETNHIGITGESLSAGPNIDIFFSGGYVVISAEGGGTTLPITGTNGTTGFTANMDCSSMMLTTGASPAGGYVKQTTRGVQYEAYPATDVSASWYNIINATNNRSNCYCIRFTNEMTAASLEDYSAYDKVTVVHSNEYTPNCMLYWDGNTKVFPSGLYCELVKGTNDQNQTDWFFTTSGWINNLEWDWD